VHKAGVRISPELRHNVFLAAKEAVNNIVKHAQASSPGCACSLRLTGSFWRSKTWRGLSPADEQKGRNGLRNMRKRMEDVGGQFDAGPGAEGARRFG